MSDPPPGGHENPPAGRTYDEVRDRLAMPLVEAMSTQRAVRRLRPDPVDPDIVLRCIDLALKAPTGSNGQNWEFVVVTERDTKAALAAQYRRAWRVYGSIGRRVAETAGDTADGLAALAAKATGASSNPDRDSMTRILRSVQWQVDHFEDLPVLVVPCLRGGKPPYLPVPAIAATSFYGSIYPSVQNLLLAARAMGLGASLITLPLWSTTAARRILGIPISVHPVCVVPMGWPLGRYGPTTRRAVGDVVHMERFGDRPWPGRRLEDRPPR